MSATTAFTNQITEIISLKLRDMFKALNAARKKYNKEHEDDEFASEWFSKDIFNTVSEEVFGDELATLAEELNEIIPSILPKGRTTTKKEKAPIKRPKTGYIIFCSENRALVKQRMEEELKEEAEEGTTIKVDPKDVTRELSKAWKALDDDEKQEYLDKAAEDKLRYAAEFEELSPEDQDKMKIKRTPSKKTTATKAKSSGEKTARAPTAYQLFCKEMRPKVKEENPNVDHTTITRMVADLWKTHKEENGIPTKATPKKTAKKDEEKSEEKSEKKTHRTLPPTLSSEKKSNPWINYSKARRASMKEENPDVPAKEITALLSKEWAGMTEEEKAEYN